MTYENREGQQKQYTLDAYSLIYKSDRWYLAGRIHSHGQMRTFRVARIQTLESLNTHFERDPVFDIAAYWQRATDQFLDQIPSYSVVLDVEARAMPYFRQMMEHRYEVLSETQGISRLRVNYTTMEEARTSILGLGTAVQITEPAELANAVLEIAESLVDRAKNWSNSSR
jgi:predicted DNA-binding transcriptional regulator YafY